LYDYVPVFGAQVFLCSMRVVTKLGRGVQPDFFV
jgi:hypothetical protein